jgi:hypothetical protein
MKKILIVIVLITSLLKAKADEGMWIPMLINQNFAEMQRLGFKMTPEQIYSINQSCMKDAIVHFGGGCTGEMISKDGIVLTNHHCGYDAIATLSSVQQNYLQNGFVANTKAEELPAEGLSVKFLARIEDVTDKVQKAIGDAYGVDVETRFEKIAKEITTQANENGTYSSDVKSFYAGNKYLLLVYSIYTDVRLVATPPENLGKFGGDTDNWMWPRHTCDFSMFRVYSNNDNKPAPYNKNNRPYVPKYHLPVSLKGIKEGDFAMIMGYPGRTTRYLTSYGVDAAINESNPTVVKIRDKRLATLRETMDVDPAVDLKYASSYASLANYWKYFIGQTAQLKYLKIVDKKQVQEDNFTLWAQKENKGLRNLMSDYSAAYSNYKPYIKHITFYREAFQASTLMKLGSMYEDIEKMITEKKPDSIIAKSLKRIAMVRTSLLKNTDIATDKKVFANLNLMYYQDVPKQQHPPIFASKVIAEFGSSDWQKTFNDYTMYLYEATNLLDDAKFETFNKIENINNILNDEAIQYALNVVHNYKDNYEQKAKDFNYEMFELNRAYQGGMLEKNKGKQMYPDANSTMRVSYGSVKSYKPKDAVFYNYYCTADGLLEKYIAGDKEFDLQPKVVSLLKSKTFGDYIDKGADNLITCFITTNDITGGNSGSPVINGDGELIGCAFDGNWEAMSGDIAFDTRYKRTICADIRYIMWVLDKVLGGRPLIDQMTIRN